MYKKIFLLCTLALLTGCVERGYKLTIHTSQQTVTAIKTVDTRIPPEQTTQKEMAKMNNAVFQQQQQILKEQKEAPQSPESLNTKQIQTKKQNKKQKEKEITLKQEQERQALLQKQRQEREKQEALAKAKKEQLAQKAKEAKLKALEEKKKQEEAARQAKLEKERLTKEAKIRAEQQRKKLQEALAKKQEEERKKAESRRLKAEQEAKRKEEELKKARELQAKKQEEERKKAEVRRLKAEQEAKRKEQLKKARELQAKKREVEKKRAFSQQTEPLIFQQSKQTYHKFGTSEIHGHVVYMTPSGEEVRLKDTKIYLVPKSTKIDYWYENYYLQNRHSNAQQKTVVNYINATHLNLEKNFAFYGLAEGTYYVIIESSYPNSAAKEKKIYIAKRIEVQKYKKIMTVFSKKL